MSGPDRMSGDGGFDHGDFAYPKPAGNVHIVQSVSRHPSRPEIVDMACGKTWTSLSLRPGNGDWPGQCARCWEAF